ncbi:EMBRYO DEFECTIVE 1637, SUMO CONJUGATION ENZYME 1, sumo conjugation enzyme 1 [Hibiscus trionum]|uniref:EMBRYO DEFECTIVE 1637, SUMO CONJUGATION ENZYME 1, sumo conjugation enzyme 1 n=1 Tax=Hibiscus trionum TaxID=183268 RepID=A0A9W7MK51_HIBTR|nr:EMBRYO DEFECTIVE 1637, SUMO CONJUGATION ENZYME 1, sumo conjugation enzyme 1 [Hibiscus trionum]
MEQLWNEDDHMGFVAKPETLPDGTVNLIVRHCTIPGKTGLEQQIMSAGGSIPMYQSASKRHKSEEKNMGLKYGILAL